MRSGGLGVGVELANEGRVGDAGGGGVNDWEGGPRQNRVRKSADDGKGWREGGRE